MAINEDGRPESGRVRYSFCWPCMWTSLILVTAKACYYDGGQIKMLLVRLFA